MTATNHVLTGAVIVLAVKQPVLVLPLAFGSHFVLDALPHFGMKGADFKRNLKLFFWLVWPLDALVLMFIFWLVAHSSLQAASLPLILTAMCLAAAPDLAWVYRFALKENWGKLPRPPMNAINRFHARIQWCERPWGALVELVWFSTALVLLLRFVT